MIPSDPMILVSFLNTQLRDNYSSLEDLCDSLDLDENQIKQKLEGIGYTYNSELNRFA